MILLSKLLNKNFEKKALTLLIVSMSFFAYIILNNLTIYIKTILVNGGFSTYSLLLYGRYCRLTVDPFTAKMIVSMILPVGLRVVFLTSASKLIRHSNNRTFAIIVGINIMLDLVFVLLSVLSNTLNWDIYYFSSPMMRLSFIYNLQEWTCFLLVGLINLLVYWIATKITLKILSLYFLLALVSFFIQVLIVYFISGKVAYS